MPSTIQRPSCAIYKTGSNNVRLFPVAASQTIKRGDLLVLSGGNVQQASAQGSNVAAVTNSANLLVIADQDSPSTTPVGTLIACQIVDDNSVLRFPLSTNGSIQAFAQTQVGCAFELHNSGGTYTVNVSGTTNVKVRVVDIDPTAPLPKGSGNDDWVLVKPIPGQWL